MTELRIENLTVEYRSSGYPVRPLQDLSFRADDGHLVVLLGPSGCGKTTLLSCLAGLLTPTSGSIHVDDIEVDTLRGARLAQYRRNTVGVVFQAFNLLPSLSARGNVMVPLRMAGVNRAEARARSEVLLNQVDLGERMAHRPSKLSGGQQQRVAIARALALDPPLVIADEPTAHLDYIQVEGVLRLIRSIAAPGRLVVVATHDERITQLADAVVELSPQRAVLTVPEPFTVNLEANQALFEMGDASDFVYIVDSGDVELFRDRDDGTRELVINVEPGGYFGELGPMLNVPRSASARATRPTVLTAYSIAQFRKSHLGRASGPGPRNLVEPTS